MLKVKGVVKQFFSISWLAKDFAPLGVQVASSASQTFFEFYTLLLGLMVWSSYATSKPVLVVGDNTGSLQDALQYKGRGALLIVARELAWRAARNGWIFAVGHLAAEHNLVPDSLSRLTAPNENKKPFPRKELDQAVSVAAPTPSQVWSMNHRLDN